MLADAIQAKFPKDIRMPDDLRKLRAFAEENENPVSGSIELVADTAEAWFGDAEAASRFAVFANGPDGSLVALWLYREMDSSQAPIVNLGSEGDENIVLAANVREFLKLLGIGYSELGPCYVNGEPDGRKGGRDSIPLFSRTVPIGVEAVSVSCSHIGHCKRRVRRPGPSIRRC